ncbi:GAF domain-containing protein [bacterium]|nr:GAF domain-containing protein [bacterium]
MPVPFPTYLPFIRRPRGRRRSLQVSLLLWFLGISLVPVGLVSWFGYRQVAVERRLDTRGRLETVGELNRMAVQAFCDGALDDIALQARLGATRTLLGALAGSLAMSGQDPDAWLGGESYRLTVNRFGHDADLYRDWSPWRDVLLLDTRGRILFTCLRGPDQGLDVFGPRLAGSLLADGCRQALVASGPVCTGLGPYPPSGDEPAGFLIQTVKDAEGRPAGLIAVRYSAGTLGSVLQGAGQLGDEGRLFLVDAGFRILDGPGATLDAVKDRPGLWLLDGQEGKVLQAVHKPVTWGGQTFGVIAALPAESAEAGLATLRVTMILALLGISVLVAGGALLLSRRIVLPIARLGHVMQMVAEGSDIRDYQSSGHNEVGDLEDQFLSMLSRLDEAREASEREYRLQRAQFELNERMREHPGVEDLARAILEHVGRYYEAQVGVMYLMRPRPVLERVAHFGLGEDDLPPQQIHLGEGFLGLAAERGRIEILGDLPAGHLPLRTGLGISSPATVIIAPFVIEGKTRALLEIGTAALLTDADLQFLERSASSVAAALDMARSRERVNRLLAETKRQAWILSNQQKQLQETNEKLERSGQYKDEFLANMSHELRTPLNSMILMSQILAENSAGTLGPDEVESARIIQHAGQDLLKIINDILDLSMVEAGKLIVRTRRTDLGTLLDHMEGLFAPTALKQGLDYRVLVGPDVPEAIETDEDRLGQVLKNLLNNAFKFTSRGTVVLRARRPSRHEMDGLGRENPDQWLALSVSDTGDGMTSEQMSRVFEAFSQGDGSSGRRHGGTGLGLSICRELVRLLGGTITVDSLEGKGSTFTVFLPLAAARDSVPEAVPAPRPAVREVEVPDDWIAPVKPRQAAAAARLQPDPVWDGWRGRRVLVGDGDMRAVFTLNEALAGQGAEVAIGRTWDQCLEHVASGGEPDLVVLGSALGGDGTATAASRWLRESGCAAPVILLADSEPVGMIDPGAAGVLTRPPAAGRLHLLGQEILGRECVPC